MSKSQQEHDADLKRAEYEARIAEWESRIKMLEAEIEQAKASTAADVGELLTRLRAHRNEARGRLDEIKKASDEVWERTRSAFEEAIEEMSAAYEAVRRRMRQ